MIQGLVIKERSRMYIQKLKELVNKNEISYCIVVNLDTNSIDKIGDATVLEYKGLVEQLFGSIQQIKLLNDSLVGQQLPRSWKQGKVKCLVCKPNSNIIVGLFYNERRSFIESIDFGNEIARKIDSIWN